MRYIIISVLSLFFAGVTEGQTVNSGTEASLIRMFNSLSISEDDSEKKKINDSLIIKVEDYIKSDSVFDKTLKIRFLGQITSPDNLLKIITWNVALSQGVQNYYCYILKRGSKNEPVVVYKLNNLPGNELLSVDSSFHADNWYGALYYDIRPFPAGNQICYLLLGLDFKDIFITRKIIDIVSFEDDGAIQFGKQVFKNGEILYNRVVFEYSSRASMMMRFNERDEIVFDHLSPFSDEFTGNYQYYGPDFSYDAFEPVNGVMILKQDIDLRSEIQD